MKHILTQGFSAAVFAVLATTSIASAASPETTSFKVKLTIEQGCDFKSTSDLDFGTHSVLSDAINEQAPAEIVIACSKDLPYSLKIDQGVNGGYKMTNGTDTVDYVLFQDASHATVWDATSSIPGTGTGTNETVKVYGQVTAAQATKSVGEYVDTVNVTVTY